MSLNCRGIRCEVKRDWIKSLKIKNQLFLLGLQETKVVGFKGCLDKTVWGSNMFQCEAREPTGLSGGIATIWNPDQFKLLQSIIDHGFLIIIGEWSASKASYGFANVYAPNDPGEGRNYGKN